MSVKEPTASINVQELNVVRRGSYENPNADRPEAIALLEAMSREEFRATLVAAGAYEPELVFSKEISGFEPAEKALYMKTLFQLAAAEQNCILSFRLSFKGKNGLPLN